MGFYRTVFSLKRAARFFFYCQYVIKIFPVILCMTDQHTGGINIISGYASGLIIIYRQREPDIVPVPSIRCISLMLGFPVFLMLRIGCCPCILSGILLQCSSHLALLPWSVYHWLVPASYRRHRSWYLHFCSRSSIPFPFFFSLDLWTLCSCSDSGQSNIRLRELSKFTERIFKM